MNKTLITLTTFLFFNNAFAQNVQSCGEVTIDRIMTGPRHQAMLQVSDTSCGKNGFVCIDITGMYMTEKEADITFSYALAKHASGESVGISVNNTQLGCNFDAPVINDLR